MRVEVDPGGVVSQGGGFTGIGHEVGLAAAEDDAALAAAAAAAGNGVLARAMSELSAVITTADRAAVLSVSGLGVAVVKAGDRYSSQDALVCRGMGVP
jgi:hypothetical protein